MIVPVLNTVGHAEQFHLTLAGLPVAHTDRGKLAKLRHSRGSTGQLVLELSLKLSWHSASLP